MPEGLAYSSGIMELNSNTGQLEIIKTIWSSELIKFMGFSDETSFIKYCFNNGFVIGVDKQSMIDFSTLMYVAL